VLSWAWLNLLMHAKRCMNETQVLAPLRM